MRLLKLNNLLHLLLLFGMIGLILCTPICGVADVTAVYRSNINQGLYGAKQIIRTSTGRLYYFSGNGTYSTSYDGWVDVRSSVDNYNWSSVSKHDQYYTKSVIATAIDANNVVHMVTYDWTGHPSYHKFNTADSPKGDHSWESSELIDSVNSSKANVCALAIDANGIPHVLYQLTEAGNRKTSYNTLIYANRVGGAWNKISIWPVTSGSSFSGSIDIAIGPDNLPYVMMGNKMLRGNANKPVAFETQDLGGGYSFVIHNNGNVRVALSYNGNYAHYLHDHAQPCDFSRPFRHPIFMTIPPGTAL